MLTQKRLREVVHYDPKTGIFTRARGKRKGQFGGTAHDARGFLKMSIDNKRYLLHHLAWLWMTGALPQSNIEHINGDRRDNRWVNLREGARAQKVGYRPPRREPTGINGVFKVGDRFEALLQAPACVA